MSSRTLLGFLRGPSLVAHCLVRLEHLESATERGREAAELADGDTAMLEPSARVGDRTLKGIDVIRFDDAGLIVDFEVMIRPLSGLQALGAAMAARIGPQLAAFKAR